MRKGVQDTLFAISSTFDVASVASAKESAAAAADAERKFLIYDIFLGWERERERGEKFRSFLLPPFMTRAKLRDWFTQRAARIIAEIKIVTVLSVTRYMENRDEEREKGY